MGLFSTSSEVATELQDNRVGASGQSVAFRGAAVTDQAQYTKKSTIGQDNARFVHKATLSDGSFIDFGSDEVAIAAIDASLESAKNSLAATTDYFENIINKVFDFTDTSNERAQTALDANNDLTRLVTAETVETPETKFRQILQLAIIGGLGYAAIKSGVFNDLVGAFK